MAKHDDGVPHAPSWQEALLVCKACGKRGSGPKHLKGKALVAEARRLLRASRARPRVLMTGCLGLCPKSAIAVAMVGGGLGEARIVAVPTVKRFGHLLPLLSAPPGTAAKVSGALAVMSPDRPATAEGTAESPLRVDAGGPVPLAAD